MKRIFVCALTVALLLPAVFALFAPASADAAKVSYWFVRQGTFTPDGVYDEASESELLTQPLNADRSAMAACTLRFGGRTADGGYEAPGNCR